MSRSYKKFWCHKGIVSGGKKEANRRVRRHKGDIPEGRHYKRLYSSYEVIDFSLHGSDLISSLKEEYEDLLRKEEDGDEVDWKYYKRSVNFLYKKCIYK